MKQIFQIIVLVLSIAACSPKQAPKQTTAPVLVEVNLKVNGMTCDDCEASIAKGVNALAGIDSISANHEDSTAFVRFDSNKTDLKEISKAIENRGFQVVANAKQ
jgi:copper chaperone CopZ